MEVNCPECRKLLAEQSINLISDLGICENCRTVFSLSSITKNERNERILPPPHGTTLVIRKEEGNSFEILLPSKKFCLSDILPIMHAVLLIGFALFLRFGVVSKHGIGEDVLAVIILTTGAIMLGGIINSIDEEQIITIGNNGIVINKNRPVFSTIIAIPFEDIQSIKNSRLRMDRSFNKVLNLRYSAKILFYEFEVPVIKWRGLSLYFFEYALKSEQEWIVYFLNNTKMRFESNNKESKVSL